MLSIGELARETGETVKVLRYWTDLGLLITERGDNRYRYYPPAMAERVGFIRSTQALGFSLQEIRGILALREEGVQPCDEVREELSAHLAAVRERIEELQHLERDLKARLKWAETHPDPGCESEGCVYLAVDIKTLTKA